MIWIYRTAASDGARALVDALEAVGGRRLRELTPRTMRRIKAGDAVVCWGATVYQTIPGIKIINNTSLKRKWTDIGILTAAGIRTMTAAQEQPEAPSGTVWLPRMNNHVGGNDLLTPPARPDFWVRKENIVREFRVHSFLGRSIRAAVKVVRDGMKMGGAVGDMDDPRPACHPWIRSWDGGWRLSYADGAVKQAHRNIAHAAVKALGLDFGAVDIGQLADRTLLVLEVNRAPGIEAGTIEAYAKAVRLWVEEGR